MKSFLCVAVAALAVFGTAVSARKVDFQTERRDIINTVNNMHTTWKAGINSRWANANDWSAVQRQLGVVKNGFKLPIKFHELVHVNTIPTSFDSRTAWPNCTSIGEIRDQSDCGSCWAFGAAEAGTDRICIATNGASKIHLSAADLLSCCDSCGMGCGGGDPFSAWSWFTTTGVVTGGNYNDFSLCESYPFPVCDHHVNGTYGNCANLNGGQEFSTPTCASTCDTQSTYSTSYAADKRIFGSAYQVAADVAQIQTEIMTNGPVEAAFDVYADFETYKSGVYQHTTGDYLGGHAVKILGWGVENNVDYWLVANSWNPEWGENGFFKILRGADECGIEDGIVAGLWKTS